MKIRTKLTLLSSILVATYGLGLVGMLAYLVSTRFLDVERKYALRDMERVVQAVQRETESLGTLTRDWAYWDDCWLYTQGRNPSFERVNLNQESLSNVHLAFVVIYNARGERRFSKELDPEKGLVDSVYFPPQAPREGLPEFKRNPSGIIQTLSGPMLAFSSAILKSDKSGPPQGFIIVGRRLDDALLATLSSQTSVPFLHSRPGHPTPEIPMENLAGDGIVLQSAQDGQVIHGFFEFRTTTGGPALIVRTTTERLIAQAGKPIAVFIGIFSLLLAGLVWGITWVTFRRWVSQPLKQVEAKLSALDLDDQDSGARDPFGSLSASPDEMGHIVGVLKGMCSRMQASHLREKQLSESLETQVEARTAALVKAHQRLLLYGKILESSSEGLVITDPDGTILEVNDAMCKQSGFSREELLGQNPRVLKSDRHGQEFYENLWSTLKTTGYWSGEIWDRKPNGVIYPKWLTINTILSPQNKQANYVGLSIDISAIKSAEERLHQMAYYDQLTGLPNRAMFTDRLRKTIFRTQRRKGLSALLFLGLDRFKNINDTLGHTVGDSLLVRVAERIQARVRETDTLCRTGGDEFTVILGEIAHLEDAGQVAAELIAALAKPFDIEGKKIYVGVTIGIALCPKDGQHEEILIQKADAAMYSAKEGGRGTYHFASGELDLISRKRLEIEAKLHGALDRNEMCLYYQPITRAGEAREGSPAGLVGAEALIRWIPEPGVVIGPGTFIGIAEDVGLIQEFGEWAIREACREASRWREVGLKLSVSVNVSAKQFENDRLPRIVRSALEASALPPSLLRLEVTESAFMRNLDKVVGIMDELRAMGVLFSIDDFGTGYSSLQYIKCLPAHCLKIDKAFVSGVAANLSDGEIVSAIIAMARAFGLKCIAEGVETEDQLRELRERGCDEVQGYFVAKPMPAEAFRAFATRAPRMDALAVATESVIQH